MILLNYKTMITEDYVSEKTAELLKEKGFNEECWCLYHLVEHKFAREVYFDLRHNNELPNYIASAPTLQMAMKWLREKENFNINIELSIPGYSFSISHIIRDCRGYIIGIVDSGPQKTTYYTNYKADADAAIKYCLENLI